MTEWSLLATIIDACLRDGTGGSPTAVLLDDSSLEDRVRCRVASVIGTSHAVFVPAGDRTRVCLRFFTAAGELPACGHGTVAALAFFAMRVDERVLRTECPSRSLTAPTETRPPRQAAHAARPRSSDAVRLAAIPL